MSDDYFSRDEGHGLADSLTVGAFASQPVLEGSAVVPMNAFQHLPILPLINEATAISHVTSGVSLPAPHPSTSESGQRSHETPMICAADAHSNASDVGQLAYDAHLDRAHDACPITEPVGHRSLDAHTTGAYRSTLCAKIREEYHKRRDLMAAEMRLTLQIKALCRRVMGGDITLADKLYKEIDSRECVSPEAVGIFGHVEALLEARSFISKAKKLPEKQLVSYAKQLGLDSFVDSINGFGYLGLAKIVGEAGDLSDYANPGKLWRRMGMAPYQGKAPSMWRIKGGLTKEGWEDAGYCPRRRSTMYVIGAALIKKQNAYRELYLSRKPYEAEKAPDLPKMAHHLRASRYMEKRLLRELWRAWRDLGKEAEWCLEPELPMPLSRPLCDAVAAPVLSPTSTELPHRTPLTGREAASPLEPTYTALPVLPLACGNSV